MIHEDGSFINYGYDSNGNRRSRTEPICENNIYDWDEENRLSEVKIGANPYFHYTYDAGGERVIKCPAAAGGGSVGINRIPVEDEVTTVPTNNNTCIDDCTVYVNPYLVIRNGEVTKHYYIEGQRIASKLIGAYNNNTYAEPGNPDIYYFHPDHLGSSSRLSDGSGALTHQTEYTPFGEILADENNNFNNRYKYNGKELDAETGLYYYGARYYDPVISNWLSVDPLAEKYPGWSPYNYTLNNPMIYIDPDGRDVISYNQEGAEIKRTIQDGAHIYYLKHDNGNFEIDGEPYYRGNSYASFFGDRTNPGLFESIDESKMQDDKAVINLVNSNTPDNETFFNFISESGNNGDYDYKNTVLSEDGGKDNSKTTYMYNGILYNRNEAGNLLWGGTTAKLGMTNELTWLGSQGFTLLTERYSDEVGEQNSIYLGRIALGTAGQSYLNRNFLGTFHPGADPTKK